MGKIRTFLSLNLSGEEISVFRKVQLDIKDTLIVNKFVTESDIKWELPEKFHLTLRFLGSVDEDILSRLISVLDRLIFSFENLEFETEGIGFFPNIKFPNVIYAGLKELGENTKELIEFIDKVIYKFYIKPEKKFIPHITIGRFRRDRKLKLMGAEEILSNQITIPKIKIEFDSFYLMESKLTPQGSIYKPIQKFNFIK